MTLTESGTRTAPAPQHHRSQGESGPQWLLRLLCFIIPSLPFYVVLPGALKGNGAPARIITLLMFGLLILGFLTYRRSGASRRINPGIPILLAYLSLWLIVVGVGLTGNDDYTVGSNRTRALLALVGHVGAALYVLVKVRTSRDRDVLLGWLAVGLSFACLVGLSQGLGSVDLRFLFEPPGFVLNTTDLGLTDRLGVTRVQGTSQHAIEFSVLAAVNIPLTIYFARNASRPVMRWLSGLGCIIAALALPAAVSRSGIISLLAAFLVYSLAFKIRALVISAVAVAAAIGAYVVLFPHVADALWRTITGSADDESVTARLDDYTKVSETFRAHPLFGLGLGGAPPAVFGYLDNEWLQAIVQGGVVGLTAMAILMGGVLFGTSAALRNVTSSREREQAYTMSAMAVGIVASSFTFDLFGFEQAALVLFLLFGMLWSGFTVPVPSPEGHRHLPFRLVSSRSHSVAP